MKVSWKDAMFTIAEIRKQKYRPNDWEESFLVGFERVYNATKRIDVGSSQSAPLTSKQGDALMRIYTKATGGGTYQKRQY